MSRRAELGPAILVPFQPSAFLASLLRTVNDYWSHTELEAVGDR